MLFVLTIPFQCGCVNSLLPRPGTDHSISLTSAEAACLRMALLDVLAEVADPRHRQVFRTNHTVAERVIRRTVCHQIIQAETPGAPVFQSSLSGIIR